MEGETCGVESQTVESLAGRLAEGIQGTDKDDLAGLAKMHGWCRQLAELCAGGDVGDTTGMGPKARALLAELELLILGEAEDAGRCFATIVESANNLLVGGDKSAAEVESDESVAARLAKVFDMPAPPGCTAAVEAATRQAVTAPPSGPVTDAFPDQPPYDQAPLILSPSEVDFVKGFAEEAAEHIEAIEAALLEVEATPEDTGKINDLFRPFHTIKGMAGFLNLRDINCLTHEAETLLDQGRKGDRRITPGLIDVIFNVVDVLKVQIAAVGDWAGKPNDDPVPQPPVCDMINRLRGIVAGQVDPAELAPGPGSCQRIGENLVEQGSVVQEIVDFAAQKQHDGPKEMKLGETLVAMKAASPRQVSRAIRAQAQQPPQPAPEAAAPPKALSDQSIRIDTAKLDVLVDMVGELVIAQTLVTANGQVASSPVLSKDVNQVSKIVREVQELAMAMRMIPIGPTFQKMARLVRDVSRKAEKQVNLIISGEDTELDKTVIQQIGDPLVHMVRNAVDHGIESPEDRRAAGKPETGNVHLGARHEGGNIVIEISDDGKGLDADLLVRKGIEKGIVQPGEELTDQQAFALIFAPGFSTAKQVTDISGRGVGMDVVKRNIDQLRGKVDITSQKGQGSTFSIRLPLTLAIIDGMIVRVGGERFIIPTIGIEQSLRPLPEQLTTVSRRGEVLNVRGVLVPLIQLGEMFGLDGRIDPAQAMVVVTHCEGRPIGLVVEELIGQQQVVIKTLGCRFERLRGISGAAILGDGKVGLILEMSGLAAAHRGQPTVSEARRPAAASRSADANSNKPGEADGVPSALDHVNTGAPAAGL